MTRLTALAIAALVLLRLLCGWHFFNEGVKKFDPKFSSAGFLRTAIGPLAPLYNSFVTGPYGAFEEFSKPIEFDSRTGEDASSLAAWRSAYADKAAAAAKAGEPLPMEIPDSAPGASVVESMRASWNDGLKRLDRLGIDGELAAKLEAIRDEKLGDAVNFLHANSDAIEDLQHEAWRLEQMREEGGRSPAPYQRDRISQKATEIWRTMQPWAYSINEIAASYVADSVAAAKEAGANPKRVVHALKGRSTLGLIDTLVKYTVLGCGVCVFLGFATRIASVVAAGFLLSLIMTQPPWVAGADLTAFFNWAIELAAFLVLATIGAGRWAGVDGLLGALCCRGRRCEPSAT